MERKRKGLTTGVNIAGVNGVEVIDGKPRYVTLSDGQVMDRTYKPEVNYCPEMEACNRSNELRLGKGTDIERAAKLLMVSNALDKTVTGLHGKESLSDMVRNGINGPTLTEVRARLS